MSNNESELAQFGVYYILPADDPLYRTGSRIVGYDVRAGMTVPTYDFIRPEWTRLASDFGFHATLTDAIDIRPDQIGMIADETDALVRCLGPGDYTLTTGQASFWSPEALVQELYPSAAVSMLHAMLVTWLHPLGSGTYYTRTGLEPASEADRQKMRLFHAPYLLDNFRPHFTCLSNFDGTDDERSALVRQCNETLGDPGLEMRLGSLALVYRPSLDERFTVYRKFTLPAPR